MSPDRGVDPSPAETASAAPDGLPGPPWRRLSARMLLIHPVRELIQFLPALLGVLIVGRANDSLPWWVEPVTIAIPILRGLLRWFTTSYRITPATLQLRTGLLQRSTVVARVDKVRTVDVTATPLHRVLGLATVKIGTGADAPFELDGVDRRQAGHLRAELLHRRSDWLDPGLGSEAGAVPGPAGDVQAAASPAPARQAAATWAPPEPTATPATPATPAAGPGWTPVTGPGPHPPAGRDDPLAHEEVLGQFRLRWVLLAPLTSSGLLVAAAIWGVLGPYGVAVMERVAKTQFGQSVADHLSAMTLWLIAVEVLLVVAVILTVLSVLSYLMSFWGYRLTRHAGGGTLHVTRGLFTSRATSLELARIRGAVIIEPVLLRLARGAKAKVLTTGFRRAEQALNTANDLLVPPAPADYVRQVVAEVLGSAQPGTTRLVRHGRAARQRRHMRALVAGGLLLLPAVLGWLVRPPGWSVLPEVLALIPGAVFVLLAPVLAEQRYASLGHATLPDTIVARSGLFPRTRSMLERDGIIGWRIRSTYFQRRRGLVTLGATTAAGAGVVDIPDIPAELATAMVAEVSPALIRPFCQPTLRLDQHPVRGR